MKTDEYGFTIWTDSDHFDWWDKEMGITIEQLLLDSKFEPSKDKVRDELGKTFTIKDDEIIYEYRYGGVLSGRGGYFIVKKNQPYLIIRSKQCWMS
jgi:hypothetical protein